MFVRRSMEKGSEKNKAVIYTRVAVSKGNKAPILMYRKACRQFAKRKNLAVVGEFFDVGSGLSLDRSGLNAMRRAIARESINTVILYDFSQLTRSFRHAMVLRDELEAHGVRAYSALRQIEI